MENHGETVALADILRENIGRLTFYINEAVANANISEERVDAMLANEREFVQALVQVVDLIDPVKQVSK